MNRPSWQSLPPRAEHNAPPPLRLWGRRAGYVFIALGVLLPAVVGGDLLRRASRGTHPLSLPSSQTLKLSEGAYVGVPAPGKNPAATPPAFNVTVQDTLTGQSLPVLNAPLGTGSPQLPLFQVFVPEEGDYLLTGTVGGAFSESSSYEILLVHESLSSGRSDFLVGLLSFFLLTATGGILLWKNRTPQPKGLEPQ